MRLPSLSSIVGDADAPMAKPSNAADKPALIIRFISANPSTAVEHASYSQILEKNLKSVPGQFQEAKHGRTQNAAVEKKESRQTRRKNETHGRPEGGSEGARRSRRPALSES